MATKVPLVVTVNMKECFLLVLRKALNVMKDVNSFITLRTDGRERLRVSVIDHFACSAMYVDIPVYANAVSKRAWINVSSENMCLLIPLLKDYRGDVKISIYQDNFASFDNIRTGKPFLPIHLFKNYAPLSNQFRPISDRSQFVFIEFVSQDLLNILTMLSIGSAVMHVLLTLSGTIVFSNNHPKGSTMIDKQLQHVQQTEEEIEGCYVIKFVKSLVNHLVNSSQKHCFLGLPKNKHDPLVLQFLLAHNTHQYYLMFPFEQPLPHVDEIEGHPQNSIKIRKI